MGSKNRDSAHFPRRGKWALSLFFFTGCGEGPAPGGILDARALETHPGRARYAAFCAPCHQLGGEGVEGGGPPLAGSPWVAGAEERLVRIVLHGVQGPIEVGGKTYQREMPGFGAVLEDGPIAELLTYARARFGASPAVSAEAVARIRARTPGRSTYWTVEELLRGE